MLEDFIARFLVIKGIVGGFQIGWQVLLRG